MRKLLVVAHPDDETLFAWTKLQEGGWKVISVTGENRATHWEMEKVMEELGCQWDIWLNNDDWGGTFNETVKQRLQYHIDLGWDMVMTHNLNGEYGHTQHQALFNILNQIVPQNLWVFGVDLKPLSFGQLKEKMRLLSIYKTHGDLGVWDWYDQQDPTNYMMKYVVAEGFKRIK
jgi:hypothetical protein